MKKKVLKILSHTPGIGNEKCVFNDNYFNLTDDNLLKVLRSHLSDKYVESILIQFYDDTE